MGAPRRSLRPAHFRRSRVINLIRRLTLKAELTKDEAKRNAILDVINEVFAEFEIEVAEV